MGKIRLGFIGLGNVVEACHLPAISQLSDDFQVVAGTDIDMSKAKVIESVGANFIQTLNEMIEREDIDIYVVATPPRTHFEVAKELQQAKKLFLLEKPATEHEWQFKELIRDSLPNQIHFAFHFAGSADTRGFRDWMNGQGLRIEAFHVHLNDQRLAGPDYSITEAGVCLGGTYMDLAANALSVLDVLGVRGLETIHRYQMFSPVLPEIDFHSYCEMVGDDVSGTMTLDWSAGLNCKGLDVLCSNGIWYTLNNSQQCATAMDTGELIIPPQKGDRMVNHYYGVYSDLSDNIGSCTCNLEMAMRINMAFFQFYELPNGPVYCPR